MFSLFCMIAMVSTFLSFMLFTTAALADQQDAFVNLVLASAGKYRSAQTELQKTNIRRNRANEICADFHSLDVINSDILIR